MKIKWWFIVAVIIFLLLVGGNIFKSKAIEKKEAKIEQLDKDVIVYRNDIVKIHEKNLDIYKDNKEIKKRFDILTKEKQKIKVIVKTKIIEVDKKLYIPKKLYDNLSLNYDSLSDEFGLCYMNTIKLEKNEKKMQAKIKGLENVVTNKDYEQNDIIKILKKKLQRRIHFGAGLGVVLAPDGSIKYGVQFGIYYRIF